MILRGIDNVNHPIQPKGPQPLSGRKCLGLGKANNAASGLAYDFECLDNVFVEPGRGFSLPLRSLNDVPNLVGKGIQACELPAYAREFLD